MAASMQSRGISLGRASSCGLLVMAVAFDSLADPVVPVRGGLGLQEPSPTPQNTYMRYLPYAMRKVAYAGSVRFAVIGEFGVCADTNAANCDAARRVAAMVRTWSPDFVVSTGGNNYPGGKAEDRNS